MEAESCDTLHFFWQGSTLETQRKWYPVKKDGEKSNLGNPDTHVLRAIPFLDHDGWLQNRLQKSMSVLEVWSHLILSE